MPFINFFVNAYAPQKNKKVVVNVDVLRNDVIFQNDIVNRENAEYLTNNIYRVNNILDKNGVAYTSAINIFTEEPYVYILGKGVKSITPIKMYIDYNVCISKQLENKIKNIMIYDEKGNILMNGISHNGLFTGTVINESGDVLNFKKGVLDNSQSYNNLPMTKNTS